MDAVEVAAPVTEEIIEVESPEVAPAKPEDRSPVLIEPDLDFIRALSHSGGDSLKKCMQCGTCSASCPLSPDSRPFPRKEMAWAVWGMKDRLMADPDVWLCHHCNDCSTACPRSSRPGDVLGAVRQQAVIHYATPRFLARMLNRPALLPVLLVIPALLLWGAVQVRDPVGAALGFSAPTGDSIVYSFSPFFPHWFLNAFFGLFALLALLVSAVGVWKFARALSRSPVWGEDPKPVKGVWASLLVTFRKILTHENFTHCETDHRRSIAHTGVLFGFLALALVAFWVVTGPYNPLIRDGFVYPFAFLSPWKILANAGGILVLIGLLMMLWDRLYFGHLAGTSSYFDWALVMVLFLVVATGFSAEVLHYLRMVPHRHVAYVIHLVFVFTLLVYLPYSKFAHVLYRTTAMVIAERHGRVVGEATTEGGVT